MTWRSKAFTLPAAYWRLLNAFDRHVTNVYFSPDLLPHLTRRETDAVLAHELGRICYRWHAGELWTTIAQGSNTIRLPLGSGIAGSVARTADTINIPDAYADRRFNPEQDQRSGYRTHTILCMPLVNHKDVVVGVIQALNKVGGGPFTMQDELRLAALCSHAAVAIDR